MKVAVLGCGPAGMMVAHACAREGVDFDILSNPPERSVIGGAQYLHVPVPGLTGDKPDGSILVIKQGTEGGYAAKVGRLGQATSWLNFHEGILGVWNLQATYKLLWAMYSGFLKKYEVDTYSIEVLAEEYDLVLSTIPKPALCRFNRLHQFKHMDCWIRTGGDLGVPLDTMIYNGSEAVHWYRASNIFDKQSKEYPHEFPGARFIRKPLGNDCDCNPWVFHLGRYGKWERGWLTSDAYTGASDILRTLNHQRLHPGQGAAQRP